MYAIVSERGDVRAGDLDLLPINTRTFIARNRPVTYSALCYVILRCMGFYGYR